jgi:hypothetical protein
VHFIVSTPQWHVKWLYIHSCHVWIATKQHEITVFANFVAIEYRLCTVISHGLSVAVFIEKSRHVAITCLITSCVIWINMLFVSFVGVLKWLAPCVYQRHRREKSPDCADFDRIVPETGKSFYYCVHNSQTKLIQKWVIYSCLIESNTIWLCVKMKSG